MTEAPAVMQATAKNSFAARPALIAFCIYLFVTLIKKFWLPSLDEPFFWVADALCFVALPLALIRYLRLPLLPATPISARNGGRLSWGLVLLFALLSCLGMLAVARIVGPLASNIALQFPSVLPSVIRYSGHIPKTPVASVLTVVYFAVTAGFVEEYFFRGLLNPIMASYLGKNALIFVAVSSVSFALIHWGGGLANVIGAFPLGVLLALVYVLTGDLRVPILAHTAYWLRWLL